MNKILTLFWFQYNMFSNRRPVFCNLVSSASTGTWTGSASEYEKLHQNWIGRVRSSSMFGAGFDSTVFIGSNFFFGYKQGFKYRLYQYRNVNIHSYIIENNYIGNS